MPTTIITLTDKPGYTDFMGGLQFVNGRCEIVGAPSFVQERTIARLQQNRDFAIDVQRSEDVPPEAAPAKPKTSARRTAKPRERGSG